MRATVPQDWIEPPTADDETYAITSASARSGSASRAEDVSETERPTSPLIAVPYVETRPLHIEIDYAGIAKDRQDT